MSSTRVVVNEGLWSVSVSHSFLLRLFPCSRGSPWEEGSPWAAVHVRKYPPSLDGVLRGFSADICCTLALSMVCSVIFALVPRTLPPLPLHWPLCLQVFFLTFFSHFCAAFLPILKYVSKRHHHVGCWAQLCPVVGLLESAVSCMGQPQLLFTNAALQLPATNSWTPIQYHLCLIRIQNLIL